jgi:hypothetical protein
MKKILHFLGYAIGAWLGTMLLFLESISGIEILFSPAANIEMVGEEQIISVGDYTTIPYGKEVTFICTRGGQFIRGDWIYSG